AAIADFDAALKAHPESAPSLYGRGLAKLARGDAAGASADTAAAQRLDPKIAQKFANWGVNLESLPQTKTTAPELTPVPPAAAPVATTAPPDEQSATPPAPAEETAALALSAEVTEALIRRGDELLSTGDIAAAR